FNAPGSDSYIIAGGGANALNLIGTATINVASAVTPTINAPITGTAGLRAIFADNTGILTLGGANTYTGNTIIDGGGTLKFTTNNVLTGSLIFGAATANPFSTTTSSVDLTSANLTVGNLDVRTDFTTTPANLITLGAGKTFTVNNTSTTSSFVG